MNVKDVAWLGGEGGAYYICLAQDSNHSESVVNTVMSLWFPLNVWGF
jgi:hypothetical protein